MQQKKSISFLGTAQDDKTGISIRGSAGPFSRPAGPFSVLAKNFTPGTTAADVENVFTDVGGHILKCEVLKTEPVVLVEAVFASREGAELVIQKFNNALVSWLGFPPFPQFRLFVVGESRKC
jgi:hypothetical protein